MPPSVPVRQDQYVVGEAARYWAPSLELADKALSAVAAAVKRTADSRQRAKLQRDLDRLLERRLHLELDRAVGRRTSVASPTG